MAKPDGLDLGVIGNGTVSALINARGDVVWYCVPRLDGDPVFCSLLRGEPQAPEPDGTWSVELLDGVAAEQAYLPNSAVLRTVLRDRRGGAVELLDFCPRFHQHGRQFRPICIVRILRPLAGDPRVRVRLRPMHHYGREDCDRTHGTNHVRYVGSPGGVQRVTTNASISALMEARDFVLDHPVAFVLGADESLTQAPLELAEHFLDRTLEYWYAWVRKLSIPFEWQDAVIRAAITLKLSVYEDTGGIVAAPTSSLPEAADSERNWDYRYCWLRDSYFVVRALNRLGVTGSMQDFLRYITNLVAGMDGRPLQPVYAISGEPRLDERTEPSLRGYRGIGPVRVGNAAYHQVQNDVYGAVVLALAQLLYDARIHDVNADVLFQRLEAVGQASVRCFGEPDAGIWELRGSLSAHTHSALMCWAGCDRLARLARWRGRESAARKWREQADRMHATICREAWSDAHGSFVASFGADVLDASVLMMFELGFLPPDDPRMTATLAAVERDLLRDGFVYRYVHEDDFGAPQNAFLLCTFWYLDALALVGRREEARALYGHLLSYRNPLGLLAEHIDPRTGELWGNFPQTYSMVGIINGAQRLSIPWEEAF